MITVAGSHAEPRTGTATGSTPSARRAARRAQLDERGRDAAGEGVDHRLRGLLPQGAVGLAVSGHHALVDAPGRLDLDVLEDGEQRLETRVLAESFDTVRDSSE
ncbi:hypothetical protein KBZ94_36670 [Streptomyces sp. RM72]|nr:hypothetical protein [Streptomyces sp. RM72]